MSSIESTPSSDGLIDFASSQPIPGLAVNTRLAYGSVTLSHCTSDPIEGRYLSTSQITIAVHDGVPFDLDWRDPESDRIKSSSISHGRAHVGGGRTPLWVRCRASPSFLAFAVEEAFISDVWQTGFEATGAFKIRPTIAVDDPVIRHLGGLGLQELRTGGPGGRLYAEGLAATLSVHLLRNYGTSARAPVQHKGGLAPLQMRRVIEYIDAHLTDELGIVELAEIANLNPHHFGEAFKSSVGISPHRFVIERRIRQALHLLHDRNRSIAEIARAVGFSSQSHFTTNLRRLTGTTPGRFRRSLG